MPQKRYAICTLVLFYEQELRSYFESGEAKNTFFSVTIIFKKVEGLYPYQPLPLCGSWWMSQQPY